MHRQTRQRERRSGWPSQKFLALMLIIVSLTAGQCLGSSIGLERGNSRDVNDLTTTNGTAKRQLIETRIVGGSVAPSNVYPFMAFTAGSMLCGATLIWSDILLTAAHCQGNFLEGVLTSGTQLDGLDGTFQSVESETIHPEYTAEIGTSGTNDIMLVKLTVASPVVPVVVAKNAPPVGDTVKTLGFGATIEGGKASTVLMEVDLTIADFKSCSTVYTFVDEAIQLCTSVDQGKDTCQGDSGGPILNAALEQVGIVSYGEGCARFPSVSTKVASYYDWIQSSICELSSSAPASCSDLSSPTVSAPTTVNPTSQPPIQASGTMTPIPQPTFSPTVQTEEVVTSSPISTPTSPNPTTLPPITSNPTTITPATSSPASSAPSTANPTTFLPSVAKSDFPSLGPSDAPSSVPSAVPIATQPSPMTSPSAQLLEDTLAPSRRPQEAGSTTPPTFPPSESSVGSFRRTTRMVTILAILFSFHHLITWY